jgi:hypothetical protein
VPRQHHINNPPRPAATHPVPQPSALSFAAMAATGVSRRMLAAPLLVLLALATVHADSQGVPVDWNDLRLSAFVPPGHPLPQLPDSATGTLSMCMPLAPRPGCCMSLAACHLLWGLMPHMAWQ